MSTDYERGYREGRKESDFISAVLDPIFDVLIPSEESSEDFQRGHDDGTAARIEAELHSS